MFEPVPIAIASLVPFVSFPMTGILSNKEIAHAYGHWLILLLMGGFMLSTMIERSRLHERLPFRLCLQWVWVSSETVVGYYVGYGLDVGMDIQCSHHVNRFANCYCGQSVDRKCKMAVFLLGLAYSASIGGIVPPWVHLQILY